MKNKFLRAALFGIMTLCIALVAAPSLMAQKPRMLIKEFVKADSVSVDDFKKIKAAVISAFNETQRFELYDEATQKALFQEVMDRESDLAMNDSVARNELIVRKSNNLILEGQVTACKVHEKVSGDKKKYTCVLTYSVTISDVKTMTTVASKKFNHAPTEIGGDVGKFLDEFKSYESAKSKTIQAISGDIKYFVTDEFALEGEVYAEDFVIKKKKLTHCYIDLGTMHGAKNGDNFTIYEVKRRVGKLIETEIGRLEIIEASEDVSYCEVESGEQRVKQAMDRYMEDAMSDENTPKLKVVQTRAPLLQNVVDDLFKGFGLKK